MENTTLSPEENQLREWIRQARSIVFFGGAGVSTESGIPDFRSADGLYSQRYSATLSPEAIISHSFFCSSPETFYTFYREKMLAPALAAEPNKAHRALAALEASGKLKVVITQNIDGLHQKAGSRNVLELHGSVLRNYCQSCGKFYPAETILQSISVPLCPDCGGTIKPDVVLYEEGLDQQILRNSVRAISTADLLIVGGTSLVVYPAAGLLDYFDHSDGRHIVLINRDATHRDSIADLIIHDSIGSVLSRVTRE